MSSVDNTIECSNNVDTKLKFKNFNALIDLFVTVSGKLDNATCEVIWPELRNPSGEHHIFYKYDALYKSDIVQLWSYLDLTNKKLLHTWCIVQGYTKLTFDMMYYMGRLISIINNGLGMYQCQQIWPELDGCDATKVVDTMYHKYDKLRNRNVVTFYSKLKCIDKKRLYNWCVENEQCYM